METGGLVGLASTVGGFVAVYVFYRRQQSLMVLLGATTIATGVLADLNSPLVFVIGAIGINAAALVILNICYKEWTVKIRLVACMYTLVLIVAGLALSACLLRIQQGCSCSLMTDF